MREKYFPDIVGIASRYGPLLSRCLKMSKSLRGLNNARFEADEKIMHVFIDWPPGFLHHSKGDSV